MAELPSAPGAPSLWLDALDYAGRVILAGRDPFADAGELGWAAREVQALVRADFVALPLDTFLRSQGAAARAPDERPARALRACLAQPALREALKAAARVLAGQASATRGLVVSTPSPGRLLRSFGATDLDEDDVDSAAVALADFLRGLAEHAVIALRVDCDADELPWLELHTPVTNVAAHYDWWTLLAPEGVPGSDLASASAGGYRADTREPEIVWLPPDFWSTGRFDAQRLASARLCVGRVPADADPARVLANRALLRSTGV